MTPEEHDTLRASMFGQRALSDWTDDELACPDLFYRWALDGEDLYELVGEYGPAEVRRMLAEVFEKELAEYKRDQQ